MDIQRITPIMFVNAVHMGRLTAGNLHGDGPLVKLMRQMYAPKPAIGAHRIELAFPNHEIYQVPDSAAGLRFVNYMTRAEEFLGLSLKYPNVGVDMGRKLLRDIFSQDVHYLHSQNLTIELRNSLAEAFDFLFCWIAMTANSEFLNSPTQH